jgi:hypothetical protein
MVPVRTNSSINTHKSFQKKMPQIDVPSILEGTEDNEDTPTTGNVWEVLLSSNAFIILVFVLSPLMLEILISVAMIVVNCCRNWINFMRHISYRIPKFRLLLLYFLTPHKKNGKLATA